MQWRAIDKEEWHLHFALLPVKTMENKWVWLERVYRRYRFIGWCVDGIGDNFAVEYKLIQN